MNNSQFWDKELPWGSPSIKSVREYPVKDDLKQYHIYVVTLWFTFLWLFSTERKFLIRFNSNIGEVTEYYLFPVMRKLDTGNFAQVDWDKVNACRDLLGSAGVWYHRQTKYENIIEAEEGMPVIKDDPDRNSPYRD